LVWLFHFFLLSVIFAPSALAQIWTENAGTISPTAPVLREMISIQRNQNLNEVRLESAFGYSWEPGQELRLVVPWVWRSGQFRGQSFSQNGLGDLRLRYKGLLFKEDRVMASERLAWLTELTLPTGESGANPGGLRLPRELQNGMGSWQLGMGVAYTRIEDRHRWAVETMFRKGLSGPIPDQLEANLAYWYRLTPERFSDDGDFEVRGVVELLASHRFGGQLPNMRGDLIWLAPGLQLYPSPDFQLELSLQIPLHQSVNDALGTRRIGGALAAKFQF